MSLNHVVGGAPSKPLHAVFDQLTVIGDAQIGGGLDIGDLSADVIEFGDNGIGGRNKLPVDPPLDGQVMKANVATGEMEWGDSGLPVGDVVITGNLTVEQNLQVDGQIISELKVEDAIIESNVGGLDSNNSGWMANGDGDTLFSGLIRDGTTKKFHLFNAAAVKPAAVGAMPDPDGDLACSGVEAELIIVGDPGVDGYQMPSTTGTADQFLTCDGAGSTAWADIPRSDIIQSPDTLTFVQAVDGVFFGESAGSEFISATPLTTMIRGGGVSTPEIMLRSGVLSSYISTAGVKGVNALAFSPAQTQIGLGSDAYSVYSPGLKIGRIGGLIRERVNATQFILSDAAGAERIKYDAAESRVSSPNGS
jgi:hypothetical protein